MAAVWHKPSGTAFLAVRPRVGPLPGLLLAYPVMQFTGWGRFFPYFTDSSLACW